MDELVDWLYGTDLLSSPRVEHKARLILADTLGCFIAALSRPEPLALVERFTALEGGELRLPGVAGGLSPASAAFALALGACWDEACEGLARAHGRPGLHAMPPALALGLARKCDLDAVLRALIAGYEVGGRMGEVLRIRPGMHVDGAWGALAAAAASALMLSVRPKVALNAIRTAACQIPFSLYAPIAAGDNARNTYVGHGVCLGLRSALAADAGIEAPAEAIADYRRIALLAEDTAPEWAPAGEFVILEGYLKPFAAVRHVHYGAACALAWRERHGGDTASITALRLQVYEEALTYCGNRAPASAIQAQFSLSYGLAWALVSGHLGPEAYAASALGDGEVRRLEALVEFAIDAELSQSAKRGAKLAVTAAGSSDNLSVSSVPGDRGQPLDAADVRAKFFDYAGPVLGGEAAAALVDGLLEAPLDTPIRVLLA